jgi:DNA-binding MarR family transcriptional regulator
VPTKHRRQTVVPPRFLTRQHHLAAETRVYEAARSYALEHGKPASVRTLADILSLNYVTVHRHLDDLERKGKIARTVHGRLCVAIRFPMETAQ